MKAAIIQQVGPPEVIEYCELPIPKIGPTEVLIKTEAIAVNPIDTYIRGGMISMPIPRPFIIGCDFAGIVTDAGASVQRFRIGDRVWGSNQGLLGRQGTFAEYSAIDEAWVYPTPENVSSETAAACALVSITAHLGLFRESSWDRLPTNQALAGRCVFVRGGSGGVGSMVIQLAKVAGATVIATASSPEKARQCRELGADVAIEYAREDVESICRQVAPQGVDLFWETARVPAFDLAVSLLAENGRMILMAGRDARPEFPVGPFYVKGCSLHGFAMFKAPADRQREAATDINRWLAEGSIRAKIGAKFLLSESVAAHRLQEAMTLRNEESRSGKIVLSPN
jgi:NADPH2:quinone reductase